MEGNSLLYENLPDKRNEELLGILKTLDGSAIFCDSVLCKRASKVVCAANQIKMAAPERSIRHGKALRIPVIVEEQNFTLRREEFSFVNTNCIFYIIDSRPQKPGMDVSTLPHRYSADRLSRYVAESAREDSVPTDSGCQCSEFLKLVEKNARDATITIIVLGCVLFIVIIAFIIVTSRGSSGGQYVGDDVNTEIIHIKSNDTCNEKTYVDEDNVTTPVTEKQENTKSSALPLQQLYEKQQKELSSPRLACDLTFASKLVAEVLEPRDDLMDTMDLTQQVPLAQCSREAFCPVLYECAPDVIVERTVAIRLIQNDSQIEDLFVAREIEEAASCSCQLVNFEEYVTEDDDSGGEYASQNRSEDIYTSQNRSRRFIWHDSNGSDYPSFSYLHLGLLSFAVWCC